MSLKVELKPGERIIIGECRGPEKATEGRFQRPAGLPAACSHNR